MFEKILNDFYKSIIAQIKISRKGAAMILFFFSVITIAIMLHFSLVPKDCFFMQILYLTVFWSFSSMCVIAYNEYCNKKDAEKTVNEEKRKLEEQEKREREKAKEKLNEFFEIFDYCDYEEKAILKEFYKCQSTSIYVDDVSVIRAMHNKGITFLSFEGSFNNPGKAITSMAGLKIINKYFYKQNNV